MLFSVVILYNAISQQLFCTSDTQQNTMQHWFPQALMITPGSCSSPRVSVSFPFLAIAQLGALSQWPWWRGAPGTRSCQTCVLLTFSFYFWDPKQSLKAAELVTCVWEPAQPDPVIRFDGPELPCEDQLPLSLRQWAAAHPLQGRPELALGLTTGLRGDFVNAAILVL